MNNGLSVLLAFGLAVFVFMLFPAMVIRGGIENFIKRNK